MRFAVGCHYHRKPEIWRSHNAWPIMAYPPDWAREQKPWYNIPLFAPTWKMVHGIRGEGLPQEEYTNQFRELMIARLPAIGRFVKSHDDETFILLCACADGRFCHRHLVALVLAKKFGCEQVTLEEALNG